MLEICVSGYLVISLSSGMFLWPALIAAKRVDTRFQDMDETSLFECNEEDVQLTRPTSQPITAADV
jgi:hypothetical protein